MCDAVRRRIICHWSVLAKSANELAMRSVHSMDDSLPPKVIDASLVYASYRTTKNHSQDSYPEMGHLSVGRQLSSPVLFIKKLWKGVLRPALCMMSFSTRLKKI